MGPAHIIAITNQKGGEGKTTTTINLAIGLARQGRRTLVIDLDPQANCTGAFTSLGAADASLIDLFNGESAFEKIVRKTAYDNLDILPSKITLAEFESSHSNIDAPYYIRDALAKRDQYEFVVMDCPPSLSIFTINALVASGHVIVPVQAEKFSMDGIQGLQNTISSIKRRINPNLEILGALLTQIKPRTLLTKTVQPIIEKYFHVFETNISDGVVVGESNLARAAVFDYAPSSKQAKEYLAFVDEVLHELQKK